MTFEEYTKLYPETAIGAHIELYHQLCKEEIQIDIDIDTSKDNWVLTELSSDKFTITDPGKGVRTEGLAHELLHIGLYKAGFRSAHEVSQKYTYQNSFFGGSFDGSLLWAIINNLAHFRMIGKFLHWGFLAGNFLQTDYEEHFRGEIEPDLDCLEQLQQLGTLDICEMAKRLVVYTGNAKFCEKLGELELATKISASLHRINDTLATDLEDLYDSWMHADSLDNMTFFENLDKVLKGHNIPNAIDCCPLSEFHYLPCQGLGADIFSIS